MENSPALPLLPRLRHLPRQLWQQRHRLDVAALAIFVAGLALRLAGLGRDSLWFDEAFTAQLAALPIPRLIQGSAGDLHPPLSYLIEWLFLRLLGPSEFAIRLPSALAGAAAAAWLTRLVGELADSPSGWLAGGLLALLPGQIWMGQEARMYALLTWLVLVAALALVKRQWNLLRLASLLVLYTHNLGAIYVAVLAGAALLIDRRKGLLTGLLLAIGWLPWLGSIVGQLQEAAVSDWIPQVGLINGLGYWQLFTTWFVRTPAALAPFALLACALLAILAGVTGWQQRSRLGLLAALAFIPPLLVVILHLLWRPILLPKPLQPATAALVGLWAVSLRRLPSAPRWIVLALLCGVGGAAWVGYVRADLHQRAPLADYADLIRANWQAGDVQAHSGAWSYMIVEHYLPQEQFPAVLLADLAAGAEPVTPQSGQALGIRQATLSELAAQGVARVWYVTTPQALAQSGEPLSPDYHTRSRVVSEEDDIVILELTLND